MAGDLATFVAQTAAATAASGELAQILAKVAAAQMTEASAAAAAGAANAALAASGATVAAALRSVAEASAKDAQAAELAKAANVSLSQAHKVLADQAKAVAKAQTDAGKSAKDGAAGTKAMGDSAMQMGQSATSAGGAIGTLQGMLSKLGPEGMAAAAAIGILTIGVSALSAAIVGGMTTAIGVVETMTQRLTSLSALAGGAKPGAAAEASIQKLSATLPFATGQLSQWAAGLLAAGVPASQLESRIKGIAAAEAIMKAAGGGGGEAAADLFKKLGAGGPEADAFMKKIAKGGKAADAELKRMGLTLAEVGGAAAVAKMSAQKFADVSAKALQAKGGGALAAMGSTFEVIAMKAKEGFSSLFTGIKIEPFMASVKGLFAMFNKGSATMGVLRPIITSVFGTLFSWATKAVSFLQGAFQQIVIAGLKVRIAINPIIMKIRELASNADFIRGLKAAFMNVAIVVGVVAGVVAGAVALIVVNIAMVVAGFAAVAYGVIRFSGMIWGAIFSAFGKVKAFLASFNPAASISAGLARARAAFAGFSLAAAAGNMITSFISGIAGKIGSVVAAMAGMGAAAKRGLLGALGIASPSKVALEAAGNVTSTFSDTVDDGKADAQKSFSGLVKTPPVAGGGKSGGAGGAADRLAAAIDRLAAIMEMSPGMTEAMQLGMAEASQEGA